MITLFVPGIPRPGGSKTAKVIMRGGQVVMTRGRPLITMRDDAKGNAEWKSLVAFFARQGYRGVPLDGPLQVEVTFMMPRLRSHYGTGKNADKLKPTAPAHHTVKPDATKLMRSTEDALTGILWRDDAAIARQVIAKVYSDRPGAMITLRPLLPTPATPRGDRGAG